MSHHLGSSRTPPPAVWDDLSANQPGRAGRERAEALHAQWRALPLLKRIVASRDEERHWRGVADGKAMVAKGFDRLGSHWHALHCVPGDGADIDHLLIGPGGVFTVNSSHRADQAVCLGADTMIVDGKRVHHIQHSRLEAARASRLLSEAVGFRVPVTGLVVIVGDKRFDVRHQPTDGSVHVTTPRAAVRWLRRLDTEWTPYGIERIHEFARRSTTWSDREPVESVAVETMPDSGAPTPGEDLGIRAAS